MRRTLLIILLTAGVVAGFGFGFAHWRYHRFAHRQAFERHVAELCVDAARRVEPHWERHPHPVP